MSGGSVRTDGWQRPILGTSRSTSMKEKILVGLLALNDAT